MASSHSSPATWARTSSTRAWARATLAPRSPGRGGDQVTPTSHPLVGRLLVKLWTKSQVTWSWGLGRSPAAISSPSATPRSFRNARRSGLRKSATATASSTDETVVEVELRRCRHTGLGRRIRGRQRAQPDLLQLAQDFSADDRLRRYPAHPVTIAPAANTAIHALDLRIQSSPMGAPLPVDGAEDDICYGGGSEVGGARA